ncbi:class I adenylate-forming enzyme family protein [Rhodococcus sp. NPDC127530]|uniref:class I adenylate-forming enzyme family protein n=1 Tax=unclassified Rhodococcus (in: high G+C Gram-positive bacteria) TaxID=192944 RepID=UPI00362B10C8
MTVASILETSYGRFAARPMLVDGFAHRTYAEIGDRVHRAVNGLRALGLAAGDRIAIISPNGPGFIEASHAAFVGGFVRVTPSTKLHAEEIRHILDDSGARIAVVSPDWAESVLSFRSELRSLTAVVVFGDKVPGAITFDELVLSGDPEPPPVLPSPQDLCALLYTSGTTGRPKGAMLTHANWAAMIRNSLTELPSVETDDVVLHVAPLSHFSGYVEPTYSARGAAHLVHETFDPRAVLDAIERHRVTVVPLVPTMLNMLLPEAEEGEYDLSSLRAIVYGGSAIAPDRLARAVKVFGDVFVQFFGLSEAPMPLAALSPRDHSFDLNGPPPPRLSSAGRVHPFVELQIRGADGGGLPAGEVGEIAVRGDTVMRGYWNQPEQTAEMIDADGWTETGDLGRLDEDGYLYIVDRKRDTIITGGYNVYPTEVENAIATLPEVQEVAVVGVPDEIWGEAVMAVVVVREGQSLDSETVLEACRQRLANYKKPRAVEFVRELPKTGSGKIMRRALRQSHWIGHERSIGG